ncbi:class I SAM-dependent methyltransferase [uncultured Dialister sp.]|uniref:class I SAM-dependent methyltransferase n=1 Tax=uncultured Dialister sp. TaxID=278064 RepID=UPI0025E97D4C|nr:class I SAM-dependent methyltransferase [uncultured Dialister sp.]
MNEFETKFEERNRKYWNTRSESYNILRQKELHGEDAAAWTSYMMENFPKRKHLRILDIGTGPAFLAIILAKAGCEVYALDMSEGMLKVAARNMAQEKVQLHLVQGDAMSLPFEHNFFDGIVSRNLSWNLPDVPKAYRSWHEVLNEGGVLLNFDSDYGPADYLKNAHSNKNAHAGVTDELNRTCQELKDSLRISTHRRPSWDVEMLRKIGFSEVSVDEDMAYKVHISGEWKYDPEPLFCLKAIK